MGGSKEELLMQSVGRSKWIHLLLAAVELTVPAILHSVGIRLGFKHKYMRAMNE